MSGARTHGRVTKIADRCFRCEKPQCRVGWWGHFLRSFTITQLVICFIFHLATVVVSESSSSTSQQRTLGRFITHFEPLHYNLVEVKHSHSEYQWRKNSYDEQSFALAFTAFDRMFNLQLEEDTELFHRDVTFQTGHGHQFTLDRSQQVVGIVRGEENSHVHGSIVHGRFRGVIEAGGETYHVEPSRAYFNSTQEFHSIMYRDRDINHTLAMKGRSLDSNAIVRQVLDQIKDKYSNSRTRVRRQSAQPSTEYVECRISVVGDHFFAQIIAQEEGLSTSDDVALRAAMARVMALYVREASRVFQRTTFLEDSTAPEGVRMAILSVTTYLTEAEMKTFGNGKTKLVNRYLGVSSVLEEFSKRNWELYCLSHLFTYRTFDEGVLGLAYVSRICGNYAPSESLTYNTAVISLSFEGERVPSATSRLVYLHEVGHNFGAIHDTDTACVPSDAQGGKYVMFPNANDGSLPNNHIFSSCSIARIRQSLLARGFINTPLRCFTHASNGSICGNRVREKEEACDCGTAAQCKQQGFCCLTNCSLTSGSVCSPQQGLCCNSSSCKYVPAASKVFCSEPNECRKSRTTCNGSTSVCPTPPAVRNGVVCNNGRATCKDGECTGSLCAYLNMPRCFCSGSSACHVCCTYQDKCTSLSELGRTNFNITGLQLFLPPGSPCNDYTGTCNFLRFCRQMGDSSALLAVQNFLFSASTYIAAYNWLKSYWWAAVLSGFGMIVLFVTIIQLFSYKTPQKILNPKYKSGCRSRSGTTVEHLSTTLEEEDRL